MTNTPTLSEIRTALRANPELAYAVWNQAETIIRSSSYPPFEIRTLRPEVTLYGRPCTPDPGRPVAAHLADLAVLCDTHAARLGITVGTNGWDNVVSANGELSCEVCGAGDPANDYLSLWCPACNAPATIHEVDLDVRWNELELSEDGTGATVNDSDKRPEHLLYRCDAAGHPLRAPENFDVEWS